MINFRKLGTFSAVKNKPDTLIEDGNIASIAVDDVGESYFFSYFMTVCVLFVLGYVGYHNKQKVIFSLIGQFKLLQSHDAAEIQFKFYTELFQILALVLEGRKGRRPTRSRRPNSANYHKLDSNLEEAVTSSCSKNTTQVIY